MSDNCVGDVFARSERPFKLDGSTFCCTAVILDDIVEVGPLICSEKDTDLLDAEIDLWLL